MGIGDWGLGIGPNPQSQSQSPIPNPQREKLIFFILIIIKHFKNKRLKTIYFCKKWNWTLK